MIAYFDTSALIPLVIAESGSNHVSAHWNSATRVASVRLSYPEGRAALARANRMGRVTDLEHRVAVKLLNSYFEKLHIVDIDQVLALRAGDLAEAHGLRGYDAVHLAAAERVLVPGLVLVAGDDELLNAASIEGIPVTKVP